MKEIKTRAKTSRKKWTEEDIETLKAKYPRIDTEALAKELDCTVRAIVNKANSLHIKRIRNNTVIDGKKFCTYCKEYHPVDNFYHHRNKHDGYEYYCKLYYERRKKKEDNVVVHQDKKTESKAGYEPIGEHKDRHGKVEVTYINGKAGKECTVCEQWKVLDDYAHHKTGAGGRNSMCKACYKARYNPPRERKLPDVEDTIIDGVEYRKCKECGETKELYTAFDKNVNMKNRKCRTLVCKECAKQKRLKKKKEKKQKDGNTK